MLTDEVKQAETLAQEFSRLVAEYEAGDDTTAPEAWNLIADFAFENRAAVAAALSVRAEGDANRDAQGIAWFERTFRVPLGDMPGRLDVERVRANAAAGVPASVSPEIEKMLGEWSAAIERHEPVQFGLMASAALRSAFDALQTLAETHFLNKTQVERELNTAKASNEALTARANEAEAQRDAWEAKFVRSVETLVRSEGKLDAAERRWSDCTGELLEAREQRDAMREALKPFVEAGSALADSIYPGVTKAKILVDIADIGQARAAIAQGEPR